MSYFQIVEFKDTQEVDIVSSSWLSEDFRQCQWPPYKGSRAVLVVKSHENPDVKWDWFDVELQQHGQTGNNCVGIAEVSGQTINMQEHS